VRSLRCKKKKVEKKFLHRKKDREMVIGYTFRVGYIYRADCIYAENGSFLFANGPNGRNGLAQLWISLLLARVEECA
jgi:hypothetical protein